MKTTASLKRNLASVRVRADTLAMGLVGLSEIVKPVFGKDSYHIELDKRPDDEMIHVEISEIEILDQSDGVSSDLLSEELLAYPALTQSIIALRSPDQVTIASRDDGTYNLIILSPDKSEKCVIVDVSPSTLSCLAERMAGTKGGCSDE